jgi:hypothetical protein
MGLLALGSSDDLRAEIPGTKPPPTFLVFFRSRLKEKMRGLDATTISRIGASYGNTLLLVLLCDDTNNPCQPTHL